MFDNKEFLCYRASIFTNSKRRIVVVDVKIIRFLGSQNSKAMLMHLRRAKKT